MYYVYALIDPTNQNIPFYVGKGTRDRLQAHFVEAQRNLLRADDVVVGADTESILHAARDRPEGETEAAHNAKVAKINQLANLNFGPRHIARVVARNLDESSAYAVEACLIRRVFGNLANIQGGHHAERFRQPDQWAELGDFVHPCNEEVLHRLGRFYVYVLRDPRNGEVFYVGKGQGDRLGDHLRCARGADLGDERDPAERLLRINDILQAGYDYSTIGHIVARVESDIVALNIEALLIKFVYGLINLENLVRGHHSGLFRAKDDWELREGLDRPRIMTPGKKGNRLPDLDSAIADGMDIPLQEVIAGLSSECLRFGNFNWVGAGELAADAPVGNINGEVGTTLKVFIRSTRLQAELRPKTNEQKCWMIAHFDALERRHVLRRDGVFIPRCYRGRWNMTRDPKVLVARIKRILEVVNARSIHALTVESANLLT